jgi:hypothetical protein
MGIIGRMLGHCPPENMYHDLSDAEKNPAIQAERLKNNKINLARAREAERAGDLKYAQELRRNIGD